MLHMQHLAIKIASMGGEGSEKLRVGEEKEGSEVTRRVREEEKNSKSEKKNKYK